MNAYKSITITSKRKAMQAHNMTYLTYLPTLSLIFKKSGLFPIMGLEKGHING
jgi:hypothetical protein